MFDTRTRLSLFACQKDVVRVRAALPRPKKKHRLRLYPKSGSSRRLRLRNTAHKCLLPRTIIAVIYTNYRYLVSRKDMEDGGTGGRVDDVVREDHQNRHLLLNLCVDLTVATQSLKILAELGPQLIFNKVAFGDILNVYKFVPDRQLLIK